MNPTSLQVACHPFSGSRIEWRLDQPFEVSVRRLHSILKSPSRLSLLLYARFGRPGRLESFLKNLGGELELMILGTVRHGLVMSALNGPKHAQLFLIGNPLTAVRLMNEFKQAGVYAPMRIMFSDDAGGGTIITYDAPSKMFGQFGSPLFRQTGEMLERKMETVVRRISIQHEQMQQINNNTTTKG